MFHWITQISQILQKVNIMSMTVSQIPNALAEIQANIAEGRAELTALVVALQSSVAALEGALAASDILSEEVDAAFADTVAASQALADIVAGPEPVVDDLG